MKTLLTFATFIVGISTSLDAQDLTKSVAKLASGRYFEREKIKFDSKYLENFSYPTHQGKVVMEIKGSSGIRLRRDHPFTIALRWNKAKVNSMMELTKFDRYSPTFFKHLKNLLNEKGRSKVGNFKNGKDQQSQFRRRAIIDELEKKSTISELLYIAQSMSGKGIVKFTPRKLPNYNFEKEEFIFTFNGRSCRYTYKVSTQDASVFASNWSIFWEASYKENKETIYQIFLGDYPPNPSRISVNTSQCN